MNEIKNLVARCAFVGALPSPPLSLSELQRRKSRNILLASLPIPYGILQIPYLPTQLSPLSAPSSHASVHHTKAYPMGPYGMGVMDIKSPQFTRSRKGLAPRLAPRPVQAEINSYKKRLALSSYPHGHPHWTYCTVFERRPAGNFPISHTSHLSSFPELFKKG
jgi:hypothetical protein